MESLEIIAQDNLRKIKVIREQISLDEQEIRKLQDKKHQKWLEIKDFGTADAIHADRGYDYMAKLHRLTIKLQKAIAAANKKIKKIEQEK